MEVQVLSPALTFLCLYGKRSLVENTTSTFDKTEYKEMKSMSEQSEREQEEHEQAKRGIFACVSWALTLALLLSLSMWMMGWTGVLVGIAIWVIIVTRTIQFFITWSPKTKAIITIDALRKDTEGNGILTIHPPGLTWQYPTEVKSDDWISLRYRTEPFSVTCPTNDGPDTTVEGSFQWRPEDTARELGRFLLVREDTDTICVGVKDEVRSVLSKEIRVHSVLDAEEKIKELQDAINEHFEHMRDPNIADARSLEEEFGVNVTTPTVAQVMSDKGFKNARTTRRSMDELRKSAHAAVKDAKKASQELEFSDAIDRTLTVHSGGVVSRHTQRVEGKNLGEQLTALLMAMSRGGQQEENNENDGDTS